MKKAIVPLLATLLLAACNEKVIDIDPDDSERQVVVMSTVEAGSPIALRLTYSRFFLDTNPFPTIEDATVTLSVNGAPSPVAVSRNGGNYTLAHLPQPGERLEIAIAVPGRGEVRAETEVPPAPTASITAVQKGVDSYGDSVYNIRLRLTDDGSRSDYYALRLRLRDTLFASYLADDGTLVTDTLANDRYVSFSCNDPMLTDNADLGVLVDEAEYYSRLLFPDIRFNGSVHDITLTTNARHFEYYDDDYYDAKSEPDNSDYSRRSAPHFTLELTSCSRDRYLFDLTEGAYIDDLLASFFVEPVPIHTNISGGIGIFAATTTAYIELTPTAQP